jgi:hypothetical protein
VGPPDTILEKDHPMTILSKFGSNWATGSRQEDFYVNFPYILSGTSSSIRTKLWWNSHWMVLFQNCVRQSRSPTKMATTVQLRCYWKQLWRGPSNDYFIKVWFQLSNWFQTRRFLCEFPIGSYVKLSSAVRAILVEGLNHRTYFWKRTIQWLFQ